MKWISTVVVAVVLAGLFPVEGQAACTITWNSGSPFSPAAGSVAGVGKYTLDTGYVIQTMTIYATPAAGGGSDSNTCQWTGPPLNLTFTGSIVGLPTETYQVFVQMVAKNGNTIQTVSTAIVGVPVK